MNSPSPSSGMRLWLGYLALCTGMFMAILDIQVVVTSLAVIEEALQIGADRMSWIQTAYLIAEVVAIPLTGLLTRVFTMRWLSAGAVTAFTLASIGCALSQGFASLIIWRIAQGFAGGVLIPLVFSAIFLLFRPGAQQTTATTIGGVLAVLAPTLGPLVGGWLTENYSWHWLFLINVGPGILTAAAGMLFLPKGTLEIRRLRDLDWLSLILIAGGLGLLLIGLKEAPKQGWLSLAAAGALASSAACLFLAVRRTKPIIRFELLRNRNLAFGCALSFLLGVCLFSSVYLMPLFLAVVRGHGPLDIGVIVLVTGVAQLVTAPIAVQLDRRFDARMLTAIGFTLFGAGLGMSAFQTVATDYNEMFWPQVIRGGVIALCILPPIGFAIGSLAREDVADGSGLFNLARNLGGAVGIALADTILLWRGPEHASVLVDQLKTEPSAAAAILGITVDEIPDPEDPMGVLAIMDSIEKASVTLAINEAWGLLFGVAMLALIVLPWMGPAQKNSSKPAPSP